MASDPVTVWVATDENGDQYVYRIKPEWSKSLWQSDCEFEGFAAEMGVSVPPGGCVEYVMLPADQYREQPRPQPAELSPVARLIAELAARFNHDNRMSVSDACSLAAAHINGAMSISAAYKIESEVK